MSSSIADVATEYQKLLNRFPNNESYQMGLEAARILYEPKLMSAKLPNFPNSLSLQERRFKVMKMTGRMDSLTMPMLRRSKQHIQTRLFRENSKRSADTTADGFGF